LDAAVRSLARALVGLGLAALASLPAARALIVDGDSPANRTAPASEPLGGPGDPGWENYCYETVNDEPLFGALYLGKRGGLYPNGILISSRHIGSLQGHPYRCHNGATFLRQGSVELCQWKNPDPAQPPFCDLPSNYPDWPTSRNPFPFADTLLSSPSADPGLPDLAIHDTPVEPGMQVLALGRGLGAKSPAASGSWENPGLGVLPAPICGAEPQRGYGAFGLSATLPGAGVDGKSRWGLGVVRSADGASLPVPGVWSHFEFGGFALGDGDSGSPAWIRAAPGAAWKVLGTALWGVGQSEALCLPVNAPVSAWTDLSRAALQIQGRSLDSDADGLSDFEDNCPSIPNPNQENANLRSASEVIGGDRLEFLWADGSSGVQTRFDGRHPPVAGDACDADFDETNRVTMADFVTFRACYSRPVPYRTAGGDPAGPTHDPLCTESDFDHSGHVGLADFATFASLFGRSGHGLPCPAQGECPF